jgi:crotonobetainyl-CoA:carnitine CoA-transferase CaiB-like acyl-CoA transferase
MSGESDGRQSGRGALADLRVVDASTLFAGPMAAMHLGDLGAQVTKVEHPRRPDPARGHGPEKDGQNLWSKTLGRNKRTVQLDLSTEAGAGAFRRLCETADVVIENFRPDTLERWGLSYETLSAGNPGLVLARVTGFGQIGPYRRRPGFGTLAEAMSGFAASTGEPDGPPTLPPFGLADGIASLATAFAIMSALHQRHVTGRGQVVDVAIVEPIMAMLGPQISRWDQLGTTQPRLGNRTNNNAPRNTYRTSDDQWVAISTSSQNIAERVMRLVGRDDLVAERWFASGRTRAEHADILDAAVGGWIAGHTRDEVIEAFDKSEAALAPVYTAKDIVEDPHFQALGTIRRVNDPHLGELAMQGPLFRMSEGDAPTRHTGRGPGVDTDAVLGELGYSAQEIALLREAGVVGAAVIGGGE